MKNRARRFAPFYLFVVITVFACRQAGAPLSETLPEIRIGYALHDHHAPLYIAALNPDYFKAHCGIFLKQITPLKTYELETDELKSGHIPLARVSIESSIGGKELIRKLSENYFDLCFGGVPAMLYYMDKGAPIKILSPVMSEGAGLVVRNDIPVYNWKEFTAFVKQQKTQLKIGYKGDISVQNLIFERALDESQIPYTRQITEPLEKKHPGILLVNLYGGKNIIPAMGNYLVDGFVAMQPFPAMAEKQGIGRMVASLSALPPKGRWEGHPCCALAANQSYALKHPSVVAALQQLMAEANRFINRYPEKSARQVAQWLKSSPDVEAYSMPTIKFQDRRTPKWDHGVDFWVSSMILQGQLDGKVKEARESGTLEQFIYKPETHRQDTASPGGGS